MNNPKDLSFATLYLFGLCQLALLAREQPEIRLSRALLRECEALGWPVPPATKSRFPAPSSKRAIVGGLRKCVLQLGMVEVPRQQDPRAPAPCLLVRWLFEPEWVALPSF